MTYALITNSTIQSEGGLPQTARRQDTQEWVLGLRDAPLLLQHACGYFEVVEQGGRPDDTATATCNRTLVLLAGIPTVLWVVRPKTVEELANDSLTNNETVINTFLSNALLTIDAVVSTPPLSLTQADLRTLQGQVKDLARIERRIIKKMLRLLDTAT